LTDDRSSVIILFVESGCQVLFEKNFSGTEKPDFDAVRKRREAASPKHAANEGNH
jgi:hypothetical protein